MFTRLLLIFVSRRMASLPKTHFEIWYRIEQKACPLYAFAPCVESNSIKQFVEVLKIPQQSGLRMVMLMFYILYRYSIRKSFLNCILSTPKIIFRTTRKTTINPSSHLSVYKMRLPLHLNGRDQNSCPNTPKKSTHNGILYLRPRQILPYFKKKRHNYRTIHHEHILTKLMVK